MGTDINQHAEWSADDDYYYATVELRTADGQIGVVEVRVSRPWVVKTARAVRRKLCAGAPAGVNVGGWCDDADPERFGKLCRYVAGEEVKRQLADRAKQDAIIIAPWFGEWTTATADAAYHMIQAAKAGDDASLDQLDRLREHAQAGDPAARKALDMVNSVAKLVARGLPPPSVVAARRPTVGALPARRRPPPLRTAPARRPSRPPARTRSLPALPPHRSPAPPTGTRSAPTTPGAPGVVTPFATTLAAPSMTRFAPHVRPSLVMPRPTLATTAPTAYGYPPPYPYGYGYPMPSSGGGGGGDMGPGDYMATEEDDGAGEMLDDDGTYYEEPGAPEELFPDEPDTFDVGEYPEEVEQSSSEDDDEGGGEDAEAQVDAGGAFPGEGSIADQR